MGLQIQFLKLPLRCFPEGPLTDCLSPAVFPLFHGGASRLPLRKPHPVCCCVLLHYRYPSVFAGHTLPDWMPWASMRTHLSVGLYRYSPRNCTAGNDTCGLHGTWCTEGWYLSGLWEGPGAFHLRFTLVYVSHHVSLTSLIHRFASISLGWRCLLCPVGVSLWFPGSRLGGRSWCSWLWFFCRTQGPI